MARAECIGVFCHGPRQLYGERSPANGLPAARTMFAGVVTKCQCRPRGAIRAGNLAVFLRFSSRPRLRAGCCPPRRAARLPPGWPTGICFPVTRQNGSGGAAYRRGIDKMSGFAVRRSGSAHAYGSTSLGASPVIARVSADAKGVGIELAIGHSMAPTAALADVSRL